MPKLIIVDINDHKYRTANMSEKEVEGIIYSFMRDKKFNCKINNNVVWFNPCNIIAITIS